MKKSVKNQNTPTKKQNFSEMVIKEVEKDPDITHMEYIIDWCAKNEIPVQKMRFYINDNLKTILEKEASSLKLLKMEE